MDWRIAIFFLRIDQQLSKVFFLKDKFYAFVNEGVPNLPYMEDSEELRPTIFFGFGFPPILFFSVNPNGFCGWV